VNDIEAIDFFTDPYFEHLSATCGAARAPR